MSGRTGKTKRRGGAFAKGQKTCIFCGNTPTTKEHVWPRWARQLLPASEAYHRFIADGRLSSDERTVRKAMTRQGAVSTLQIERVCGGCNSGWMSGCETSVQPFLTTMIEGSAVSLDECQAGALRRYLIYKLMIIDWMDGEPVLLRSLNEDFFRNGVVPVNTSVHLFRCREGRWQNALRSYFGGFALPEDFVGPDQPRNSKSIALGFGSLFVFAIFSTQVDFCIDFDSNYATRLWPNPAPNLTWPPAIAATSEQAEFVAGTLERLARSPLVRDASTD